MITKEIEQKLFELQDSGYREMQVKIIPNVDPETIIGVRTPALRDYAKSLAQRDDLRDFLDDVPHEYFDMNQLHAFIISAMKDYEMSMDEVEVFLPYVDNWATCDQMSPKVFKKNRDKILPHIMNWLGSDKTYTIRFGIGMLMEHFLDEDFDPKYLKTVAKIRSEEYYVNMMIAWYFATALAKQYDEAVPYIENKKLDTWTHNKAIQKSVESYRITAEQKEYLKSLKIKNTKKS